MTKGEKANPSKDVLKKTGFDRIYREKIPENRAKLVSAFIEERLNRVDIFGVIELIAVAAATKVENKPESDQITSVILDYVTRVDEPILKTLTNDREGKAGQNVGISKLRQMIKTVYEIKDQMDLNKKQAIFEGKSNYILRLIDSINDRISQSISDDEGRWTLIPINEFGRNDALKMLKLVPSDSGKLEETINSFDEGMSQKEKLLSAVLSQKKKSSEEDMVQKIAHLPIYIMEILQSTGEPNMYWDKLYGGVSLKQVFSEPNLNKQKKKLLEFLKQVPRGDIFWHTIINEGIFGRFGVTDEDGIHKTKNSETLLGLQYSVATDLLINQPANSQRVSDMLKAFYELQIPVGLLLEGLEVSYYFYQTYISKSEKIFSEDLLNEFMKEKNNLPAILFDEMVDWYLKRNIERIQAYLVANAPSEQMKNNIRQWGAEKKRYSYIEAHSAEILSSIKYVMGDQLWKMLFIDEEQQKKTESVSEDITESVLNPSLWPTEVVKRVEKFDPGSLPYMFGIDNIKFGFEPGYPDIMVAAIQLKPPRSIALLASIQNINGKIEIGFSIDPKENKEILQILKLIVAVELRDNLADIKLENDGFNGKSEKAPEERSGKIKLIKAMRRSEEGKSSDDTSSRKLSEKLNEHAARKNSEFKPRTVECHARHLSGANNYLEAVRNYQQFVLSHDIGKLSQDEALEFDSLTVDARLSLDQMDKISDRKEQLILSLSDKVQKDMELITDPIDGKKHWLSTWVIKHVSPAPDPSLAGNLRGYYDTYIADSEGPRSAIYNPLLVTLSNEPKSS